MKRVLFVLSAMALLGVDVRADYLGIKKIDDYLHIRAKVLNPSTGALAQPTAITYSIYEEGSATGIVEGVDMVPASPFDTITGAYLVSVQLTTVAGFEAGKDYQVWVTWTVNSVTLGEWHAFQIGASVTAATVSDKTGYSLAADQEVDVVKWGGTAVASARVAASLDSGDVTGNLPAIVEAYTVQPTVTGATLDAAYDAAKTASQYDPNATPVRLRAATQASIDAVEAGIFDPNATPNQLSTTALGAIAALMPTDFDTVTVADNKIAATAQLTLSEGDLADIIDALSAATFGLTHLGRDTAQAGTATTITLAAGASATDRIYQGARIVLYDGTGAGQANLIVGYNGTTKVASCLLPWIVIPDATSVYEIQPADGEMIRMLGGLWR